MVSWCCLGLGLLLVVVSFFTVGLVGFLVFGLSLLLVGFGCGLLCSRRVQLKIVGKERVSR